MHASSPTQLRGNVLQLQRMLISVALAVESVFDATATQAGAIGRCATPWTPSVANATYGTSKPSVTLNEFRCAAHP